MTKDKNNMDDFLRSSLESFEVKPSQNVWGKISKRLLILELVRLNFTNVGKYWLYSGMAALTTVAGLTYFNLNSEDVVSSTDLVENGLAQLDETENNIPENTSKALLNSEETNKEIELEQKILIETVIEEENLIAEVQNTVDVIPNLNQDYTSVIAPEEAVLEENDRAIAAQTVDQKKDANEKIIEEDHNKSATEIEAVVPVGTSSNSQESTTASSTENTIKSELVETEIEEIKTLRKDPVADQTKKTQKSTYKKSKENNETELVNDKLRFSLSVNYMHTWPLDDKSYIPQSNLFMAKVGANWKRWEFRLGIGLQTEKSTSRYQLDYESFDSVGYFFDISHYETIPGNPDSIIIHYIERALYDTVAHSQMEEMKLNSRWVVVPIEIGYELLKRDSYVLAIGLSAHFGWEYYRDQMQFPAITSLNGVKYQNLGSETTNSFISLGLSLNNQFKIYNDWWFVVEPQIYYYLKTPYKWENSNASGPVGFGINVGIKYKF